MQKYEKEKKIWTHEGPRRKKYRDTWRSQGIEKKDEHMKEYIIDLEMSYPHTCTSWSKGMTSFSLDLSFDLTKYAE